MQQQLSPSFEPNEMDVICGRGNKVNHHPGNKVFRRLIEARTELYKSLDSTQRPLLIKSVVLAVKSRGLQFMTKNEETGQWSTAPKGEAIKKTKLAFRRSASIKVSPPSGQAIASLQSVYSTQSPKPPPNTERSAPLHRFHFNKQGMIKVSGYLASDEATANTTQSPADTSFPFEGLSNVSYHPHRICSQPTTQSNAECEDDGKLSPAVPFDQFQALAFQQDSDHTWNISVRGTCPTREHNQQRHAASKTECIPSGQTVVSGQESNLPRLQNTLVTDANQIEERQLMKHREHKSQETLSASTKKRKKEETETTIAQEREKKEASDTISDSELAGMYGDDESFDIEKLFD